MVVHPCSHRVSRVRRYSGYLLSVFSFVYVIVTLCDWPSQTIRLDIPVRYASPNPKKLCPLVWPAPRSLATTCGISVDVFSSSYLDVSVQTVPFVRLFYSTHDDTFFMCRVPPFGYLRINAYLPLPEAFRSLSRPSSAPDAKAFTLRSY